jgi:tetratricopeptide (TPR) repeat protein
MRKAAKDLAEEFRLGMELARAGQYEEAARHFAGIVGDDTDLDDPMSVPGVTGLIFLGECKGSLGNWKEAVNVAAPTMAVAIRIIGHFAEFVQKAGNYEHAAFLYSFLTALVPGEPDFAHGAGYNKMMLGRWDDALHHLRRAAKLKPESPAIWYDFGSTLTRMGRKGESRPVFRKVLRLNRKSFLAWYDLACLDALEGKVSAAFRNLQHAVDCGFRDVTYLMIDPDFTGIQADPRWAALLDKLESLASKKPAKRALPAMPVAESTATIQ